MNVVLAAEQFGVCRRTIHNWVTCGLLERDGRGLVLVPDGFVAPRRRREHTRSERGDKTPRTEQVVSALKYGPLTFWQLAERLPGTRKAIAGAVNRAKEDGMIALQDGSWCLTASLADVCNQAHG